MLVELTRDQISVIKQSLRYSIHNIAKYDHKSHEIKKASLKPVEDVLAALPDLRKAKE